MPGGLPVADIVKLGALILVDERISPATSFSALAGVMT
jgi:hypothetical protein